MVRGIPCMKLFVAAATFRIMAVQCQQHVQQCVLCKAANSNRETSMSKHRRKPVVRGGHRHTLTWCIAKWPLPLCATGSRFFH